MALYAACCIFVFLAARSLRDSLKCHKHRSIKGERSPDNGSIILWDILAYEPKRVEKGEGKKNTKQRRRRNRGPFSLSLVLS
jgi:hypothetical protein